MFDRDNLLTTFIDIACFASTFYFGKKSGKKEATQEIINSQRDYEMQSLREEIQRLKNNKWFIYYCARLCSARHTNECLKHVLQDQQDRYLQRDNNM